MNKLKSEFSLKHVVIIPVITSFIIVFMIFMISFLSFEMVDDGTALYKTPIWAVILFGLLFVFSLYYYLKTFKKVEFDDKGIHISNVFKREFHSWKAIRDIRIIGKEYEIFLWQYLVEDATSIQLNNRELIVLFSKYYKNMPELRTFLQSHVIQNLNKKDINLKLDETKAISNKISSEANIDLIQFKGNHFFTLNTIITYGLSLMFFFLLINRSSSMTLAGALFLVGLPLFLLIVISCQLYFFELENNYLNIKNHIPFFKPKKYKLSEIKSVFIEMDYKRAHKMRIITNDFKVNIFMANSLREKHWKHLIKSLKERGIEVVDELFFE